jgi:hypothetical protein
MDPALERLWLDVETERVRLRAQYAGYRTGPNLPELERRRTEEWVRAPLWITSVHICAGFMHRRREHGYAQAVSARERAYPPTHRRHYH